MAVFGGPFCGQNRRKWAPLEHKSRFAADTPSQVPGGARAVETGLSTSPQRPPIRGTGHFCPLRPRHEPAGHERTIRGEDTVIEQGKLVNIRQGGVTNERSEARILKPPMNALLAASTTRSRTNDPRRGY